MDNQIKLTQRLESLNRELWTLEEAGRGQHPSIYKRIDEIKAEIKHLEKEAA